MTKNQLFLIIFGAGNLGLILYGLLSFVKPDLLLENFSHNVYQFPLQAESAIVYLQALYRLLGALNLLVGASGLFLLWRARINAQPWLIRLIILMSLFAYIGPIVFDNTVGNIGVFEIIEHILFAAMLVTGFMRWKK